jgi:hypothetical protein
MSLPGPDDQHMPIQGRIWVTLHVLGSDVLIARSGGRTCSSQKQGSPRNQADPEVPAGLFKVRGGVALCAFAP